jgi:hypothetical protein
MSMEKLFCRGTRKVHIKATEEIKAKLRLKADC